MLGPWLLDKATPEQQEARNLRAYKGRRIAASKARAVKARSDKRVAKIESELQKALEDQGAIKRACARAEERIEFALAKYQEDQASAASRALASGGDGGQGPGGEDSSVGAGEAAKALQQLFGETLQALGCERGVAVQLNGSSGPIGRGTPERKEQPRRYLESESEAARILEDNEAKARIAKTQ